MNLDRDFYRQLNESIHQVRIDEQYVELTEEQFNEAYEDYIDFLAENYTDEELENMTEEELMEGFFGRLAGAAGTAVHRTGQAIKGIGKTVGDMRTQYKRGLAGELTWTGAERYPTAKEEPKKEEPKSGEKTPPPAPDAKKPKTKLTPDQINKLKNSPDAVKLRKQRAAAKGGDELAATTMKQRMAAKGLIVNKPGSIGGGTSLTPAGKAVAGKAKDISTSIDTKQKEEKLNKKRGAAFSKCIEKGGDEKKCTKYASSIMASVEYYRDLRQRLLENYKK